MLLLYLGVDDLDRSGKPYQMWAKITEQEYESGEFEHNDFGPRNPFTGAHYYDERKMNRAGLHPSVGMVYEFQESEKAGSLSLNGYKWRGKWPKEAQRREWDTLNVGRKQALRAHHAEKVEAKVSPFSEALEPVRLAMIRLPQPARMQLLAAVTEYITRR